MFMRKQGIVMQVEDLSIGRDDSALSALIPYIYSLLYSGLLTI